MLRQAERRVVHTLEPLYPGATLRGSLPALVVHLSEHKLRCVRAVLDSVAVCTRYLPRRRAAVCCSRLK